VNGDNAIQAYTTESRIYYLQIYKRKRDIAFTFASTLQFHGVIHYMCYCIQLFFVSDFNIGLTVIMAKWHQ